MKKLLILILMSITDTSCNYNYINANGEIVTEKRQVANFTGVSASNAFEVEIKIGPVTEVLVEADENVMEHIVTRVTGNMLKIRTEEFISFNGAHLKVIITTPELLDINASSSAEVKVLDVIKSNNKVNFQASSSAEIEAIIEAPVVEIGASSSGSVNISGSTKNYKANGSSGSHIKTRDLLSENTSVNVSSGAVAEVYASVSLDAEASSGGSIRYQGEARVKQNVSSGGSVEKRN